MNRVHRNLWVTDIDGVREGSTQQFDRVISVCQDEVSDNVGCSYEYYNMSDGDSGYGGSCEYELFHEAADSLHEALCEGETVLIHCHVGRSRSVAVASAVVARQMDTSFEKALKLVRERRGMGNPNEMLREHGKQYVEGHSC